MDKFSRGVRGILILRVLLIAFEITNLKLGQILQSILQAFTKPSSRVLVPCDLVHALCPAVILHYLR